MLACADALQLVLLQGETQPTTTLLSATAPGCAVAPRAHGGDGATGKFEEVQFDSAVVPCGY